MVRHDATPGAVVHCPNRSAAQTTRKRFKLCREAFLPLSSLEVLAGNSARTAVPIYTPILEFQKTAEADVTPRVRSSRCRHLAETASVRVLVGGVPTCHGGVWNPNATASGAVKPVALKGGRTAAVLSET